MTNTSSLKFVLGDTVTETSELANAVWLLSPGEGNPIKASTSTLPGGITNWRECFSAFNAVSDWVVGTRYNHGASTLGLHLYAGKELGDRFAGVLGVVHTLYQGTDVPVPDIDEFPLGWAVLSISQASGQYILSHQEDMRSDREHELSVKFPNTGAYDHTEQLMCRKHNWIDALLTGRPVMVRIAGFRQYVQDRLDQWALPEAERNTARAQAIQGRKLFVNNVGPALETLGETIQGIKEGPRDEQGNPKIAKLVIVSIDGKKVDLAQLGPFTPVIYDKRGKIWSTNYSWNPSSPASVAFFMKKAEEGFRLGNLPQ